MKELTANQDNQHQTRARNGRRADRRQSRKQDNNDVVRSIQRDTLCRSQEDNDDREVDSRTIHINQTTQRHRKFGDSNRYTLRQHAANSNRQCRSTGRSTPSGDPCGTAAHPHRVRVLARECEEDERDDDEEVQNHTAQCAADQDAKIDADFRDVKTEQVGHDQEEDTNRCEINQHRNDLHDDLLDFLNRADQRAAGLDTVPEHHSSDENCQKRIRSHGINDIVGDQRVEHVDNDFVNLEGLAFVDGFLVSFVDLQLVAADYGHEL